MYQRHLVTVHDNRMNKPSKNRKKQEARFAQLALAAHKVTLQCDVMCDTMYKFRFTRSLFLLHASSGVQKDVGRERLRPWHLDEKNEQSQDCLFYKTVTHSMSRRWEGREGVRYECTSFKENALQESGLVQQVSPEAVCWQRDLSDSRLRTSLSVCASCFATSCAKQSVGFDFYFLICCQPRSWTAEAERQIMATPIPAY